MTDNLTPLLPCPFCGGDARNDAHADDCYFILHKAMVNAPNADLSMVPDVLKAWNRRAALAQAQSLPAVPEIDYQALIDAAYKRDRKWAQGTNGCIAFKHGAEWFRDQVEASPAQPVQPSEQAAFEDWIHRVCPSGDVTEVQRQWEASSEFSDLMDSQTAPIPLTWREASTLLSEHLEGEMTGDDYIIVKAVERHHGIGVAK